MTLSYIYNRKRIPNFTRPKNLSENIIAAILNNEINQYADYADKYKVRSFVERRGLGNILPQLYAYWLDAKEISFEQLPNKFVLKANNGCGSNVICRDKNALDAKMTIEQLNEWLKLTPSPVEAHYRLIKPRIICEEYIEDRGLELPVDYKFMCFRGEPHCVLVCTNRVVRTKLTTMDLHWKRLDYLVPRYINTDDVPRPKNLGNMIDYARKLADGFDFVRVDLYDTGSRVYFGELTFTPQKGIMSYFTEEALEIMGNLI